MKCFLQSLPVHMSYLFFILLNEDIAEIEKPDGICLLTFAVDEFPGILFKSINLFYYAFKICKDNKKCFITCLILIKFYYFSVFRRHNYITKTFIFTYIFARFTFVFCWKRKKATGTIKITLMSRRYSS